MTIKWTGAPHILWRDKISWCCCPPPGCCNYIQGIGFQTTFPTTGFIQQTQQDNGAGCCINLAKGHINLCLNPYPFCPWRDVEIAWVVWDTVNHVIVPSAATYTSGAIATQNDAGSITVPVHHVWIVPAPVDPISNDCPVCDPAAPACADASGSCSLKFNITPAPAADGSYELAMRVRWDTPGCPWDWMSWDGIDANFNGDTAEYTGNYAPDIC